MKSQKGFTLFEVLIAMGILAFLALYTTQSIRDAISAKGKIQKTIDKSTLVHSAVRLMQADFKRAFNYTDISVDLYNQTMKKRIEDCKKGVNQSTKEGEKDGETTDGTSTSGTAKSSDASAKKAQEARCKRMEENFKPKTYTKLTHFQGSSDSVHFTSLNNLRALKDSPVSDQAEIGYFLKSCKSRSNKSKSSQCLWRRVSPYLDDKVDEGGDEMVLLENVTNFELRYLGPQKDEGEEWIEVWKSGEGSDDFTKDNFPHAVEVTLTVHDKSKASDKPYSMSIVAPIRFPNNPKKNETTGTPPGRDGGSGATTQGGSGV